MLILASGSPRRQELLAQAGYTFTVRVAGVPETERPGEAPIALALRLAREKAEAVQGALIEAAGASAAGGAILGADTIVIAPDGSALGKPRDAEDAARMLRLLSGSTHRVVTGVCLLSAERAEVAAEVTWVSMLTIGEDEISAYVASGEPMDKAGAYAIQGRASRWIPRIRGCYFNVVGLPVALVCSMLDGAGVRREARSS